MDIIDRLTRVDGDDEECHCHPQLLRDAIAEIKRLRELTEWQPIDTAPKDNKTMASRPAPPQVTK